MVTTITLDLVNQGSGQSDADKEDSAQQSMDTDQVLILLLFFPVIFLLLELVESSMKWSVQNFRSDSGQASFFKLKCEARRICEALITELSIFLAINYLNPFKKGLKFCSYPTDSSKDVTK